MIVRIALAILSIVLPAACGVATQPATPTPTPTVGVVVATDPCSLITVAELTAIFGTAVEQTENRPRFCNWADSGDDLAWLTIGFEDGYGTVSDARQFLDNPTDINVGGVPAVIGLDTLAGAGYDAVVLYAYRGSTRLLVSVPDYHARDTPELRQQIIKVAETAVGRWR